MGAEPIELVIERILGQYNRKPEGWSVLTDQRGNVLVLGPGLGYRLKLIPLNPQEYTGVGARIRGSEEIQKIVEGIPSYGFRPLSREETRRLLEGVQQGGALQDKLIEKLLGTKPVPTWELQERRPEAILSGPVIAHPDLSAISRGQEELEKRLAVEAMKLFRKRYPLRAGIYG